MNYQEILDDIENYVSELIKTHADDHLIYHGIKHTQLVVSNAKMLAGYYKLNERDTFIVSASAWFHDTGYCNGTVEEHEERGVDFTIHFLNKYSIDKETLQEIAECIQATTIPQNPKNLLQEIICDADLFHFGTEDFDKFNESMKLETEHCSGEKISDKKWKKSTIKLLEGHTFKTSFGKDILANKKAENIAKLKKKKGKGKTKSKEELPKRPDRGIETMFRISSNNHQRLSDMADNKAHIMVTTTSIILSVVLTILFREMDENQYLFIPNLILSSVCVVTMVFSILATRPTIPNGTFTPEDLSEKRVNLLFFGNFYKMPFEDFSNGMSALMEDRKFLYGSLTRDIYSQGVVLGRKYRLLRIAYNIFMFGVVVSVLAFITMAIIQERNAVQI
ncbi:Pycsar system effector family protein [Arcticibacterium luteifluviistationis]|uniref:Phosphohydrolase n=1 Tax=Arcticibacterium luteifluviistationis TaxID=1784714 RepID=A0A2Z4GGJ9_9BACT|nr:Pycsar system effector family protein [Arcticibacterium luteifluviistationis]AWW00208.1 phosphohydrolase [Arcticibacterium luteifluviistationis]